jgi:hypothetical protein
VIDQFLGPAGLTLDQPLVTMPEMTVCVQGEVRGPDGELIYRGAVCAAPPGHSGECVREWVAPTSIRVEVVCGKALEGFDPALRFPDVSGD